MPSILGIRKRQSDEKDLEDPDLSKSAIENRVYCIVYYLCIVCSLKGTGLPSGCDIGLTDTFFLPHCDTFGRGHQFIYINIKGKGTMLHNNNKVKFSQRCKDALDTLCL
jgi:hypothetical protein